MSSAASARDHGSQNGTSSSHAQGDQSGLQSNGSDSEDDPVAQYNHDDALLAEDPLGDLGNGFSEPTSFKRKPSGPRARAVPRLLTTPPTSSRSGSPNLQSIRGRTRETRRQAFLPSSDASSTSFAGAPNGQFNDIKGGALMDWHVEGPGRRVGYEDLSTIDWIFEYAKERQRLRILRAGTSGIFGSLRRFLDRSHVWIVLILSGIAVGILAAGINVVGDWLGDIKFGYCQHKGEGGGQFYLNKNFCCWGHDDLTQCTDWKPWRAALRIPSVGGGYVVELIFYILFSTLFAVCASFLVKEYAIYARHSGIPEIKTVLGGLVIRRFMGAWTLVVKSLGLCLSVASGLWAGKEGPLIHVACCCANLIMKPFGSLDGNEARRREVMSAAAAAGISVAFGSPIGGVLFSLEQLSYYFPDKTMWQSFVCAMVAAVTLQFINPFRTGKIVLYQVSYSSGWHDFEIPPFIILGIIGGVYGGLFIKLNMLIAKFRKSSTNPLNSSPVIEVLLVAFFSAVINFPNIFMRAQLSELVYNLFAECAALGLNDPYTLCKSTTAGNISNITLLLTASGLGFFLAAATFGLLLPAGIILPSLAIGALYGRALGVFMQLLHSLHPSSFLFSACEPDIQCITPGTYAIVGAASALAGVTRMTVSIVVIMFELTGALTYVLPIMIAVMLSKWIGDALSGPKGIYESWINFNGYPYLPPSSDSFSTNTSTSADPTPDIPAATIMTPFPSLICLPASNTTHTISSLLSTLSSHPYRGYPIISSATDPILLGYISRTELSYALDLAVQSSASPLSTPCTFGAPTLSADDDTATPQPQSRLPPLDLRLWIDATPITLNVHASFALTKDMFQKLGVRWIGFVERGRLRGLVTKKDVWEVVNGVDRRSNYSDDVGIGWQESGVARRGADDEDEDDDDVARAEERGLLGGGGGESEIGAAAAAGDVIMR